MQETDAQVDGFRLIRIISDRERSKVHLARDSAGVLRAVKVQLPADPAALPGIGERYGQLEALSSREGLLPILAHGTTPQGWVWERLPLADNLPGLSALHEQAGIDHYTPLTLRGWSIERGPASAEQVIKWGLRLAGGLQVLHEAGLVHRDVKPTNILFVGGELCLGDYGLVGRPGSASDFSGTEGFQPLEGTNDKPADLFALGRTLYEAWTAMDRLEFPSLPKAVVNAPDWNSCGRHLNALLLRACHALPSWRFRSAAEFIGALEEALEGRPALSRRKWLVAAGGVAAVVAVGGAALLRSPSRLPRLVWKPLRKRGFNVEGWRGDAGTADWVRRRLYSLSVDMRGCALQSVDLDRFALQITQVNNGPGTDASTILHPETRWLWAIEGGHGEVVALEPESLQTKRLGGGPTTERHHYAKTYWNPITRRVGIFGGYGNFAVRNDRSEFDEKTGNWIEIEPDRSADGPCRRGLELPLVPDATGKRLFVVGGRGSPSGKQGERDPGLRGFDGQFHKLDDIWELDLERAAWRQLLSLGHFRLGRLRAAVYHPRLKGLVLFEGMQPEDAQPGPAKAFWFRPGEDKLPLEMAPEGDSSILASAWACTMEPQTDDVLLFASDGIFRVTARASDRRLA
jgi:hypothetical protein